MPTCLVTGASGFIGPRLVARLQRAGKEVVCLVRSSSRTDRLEPLGVRLVRGDVTDAASLEAAVDGVDEVYHLAGKLHASKMEDYLRVNEQGTVNLAEACARQPNPPVLVFASSLAAAGPSAPGGARREGEPSQPISKYGKSKLAAENALRRFADATPISIVRPPVVFGPGDRDGFILFNAIRRTRVHVVPNKSGLPLSLVYSDDLCDAFALAAERGGRLPAGGDETDPSGMYYAAHPEPTTWAEVGRMVAAALGVRVLVLKFRKWPFLVPALVGDLLGKLTGKPTVIGMDKLRDASASGWVCAVEKARDELGFEASAPLPAQYAQTCAWYREAEWL